MALIKRLDFSAKNRRNKCSKHLNNCTSNKISRSSISGTKNNLNQQKNNLFSLNSKQLINDQLLIKKQNYGDISKKRSKNTNQVYNNLDEQHFTTNYNQFCSCCFLDKQSSSSLTSSPSCLRDSSSSPKSTVTHISNNLLYSDQNSQSSESSNFWCSTPSSSENQNSSTDSFLNEEKSNTINNNLVNYLNNNNNNTTTNRITPTFRSFNQVHQQASKNFQSNQLSFTTDNELPKSYSQFYNKTYHHSFTNHLLNYLNSPNQHFFFVNRLLAQKANSLSNCEKNNLHENTNKLPDNCSFRLPNTLSISLNNKNHQQKFKKNSTNKFEKKRLVSRIVAKIRAKNFLKMYRNNSTSTSLQSQITLQPNGSFHKLGSNVALAWEDINVYKPIPIVDQLAFRLNSVLSCDEHNLILKQLNGVINFGQMFAIMGPSGAGKSTLLKCLFGTANVKYDGKLYVQNKQVKAVFITQNEQDHLLMNLTVEEAIYYSSNLKMNKSAENEKIEQLIQQLELTNCRSTLVKSCSGGQKKRIAIAQELVGSIKPRLLFLDEPTSGLDSNVSFVVLSQLQKLCRTHHIAIVATIHQPSFKLVELFDQLYIISKGGKCVFFGQPRNLKSHLKEFEVRCPEGHNPADIAIDYAAINTRMTKEDIIQNKVLEKLASEKKRLKAKNKKKKKLNDLEADSLDKDDESEEDGDSAICKNDNKQRCIVKHYKDSCTKKINNLDKCCNNYCCCTCCGQRDNINKLDELIRLPTAEFYIGKSPPYNLSEQKLYSNDKSQMVVNIESSNGLNFGENRYSNNLMNFTDNFDSFYNQNNILNRYSTSNSTDAIRTFRFNQSISERTAFKHCSVISNTSAVSTMESKIQTVRMIEQAMESNCRSQVAQVKTQVKGSGTQRLREIQKLCENRNSFSFRHTWSLFKRTFTNSILREPKWLMIRIGLHCLVAIVLFSLYDDSIGKEDGCILLDQQDKLPSYMVTRDLSSLRREDLTAKNVSFLFFNLLFLMFAALMPTVLTFPTEIKVFLNEHRNGWYSTCSYYWAKTITELLIQLPLPYFYCLFMYWSTKQFGLNQLDEALPWSTVPSRFREFAFICVMASFIAQGMGFLIGALFTTNFNISIFVATIVMLFNFLFSGFFVKIKDMGDAALITNLSFIRFSFESIMLSIYGFDRCEMYKHMEMNDILKMKNINVNQTEISNEIASYNQIKAQNAELMKIFPVENKVVQAVLYRFEITDSDFNLDIYGLFAHLVLWRLLTYVVLFIKANPATPFSNLFLKLSRFQDLTLKFIKWFCIIQIICFVIGIIIIIVQLNV